MGCVKLHILEEQYKRTELRVSYFNKELTFNNSAENPRRWILVKYIDPDGRELLLFKNEVYVGSHDDGKKEVTGFNQRSTTNEDGEEEFTGADTFAFNDIGLDRGALESGDMTLDFVSQSDINNIMGQSGVNDQSAFSRWGYAANESNANSLTGNGNMDYRTNNRIAGDDRLYVMNGVGYNSADAGNYLWGYAMGRMGFTSVTARAAAHANAWWSAKESNGQRSQNPNSFLRWFENRSWGGDAKADQRAIQRGLNNSGSYWKAKKKSLKKLWE